MLPTSEGSPYLLRKQVVSLVFPLMDYRSLWLRVDDGGKSIRRAQVKVGLINLFKGLFSLNARIYYSIAHRQAARNLPGGYSTILPHKGVYCNN
jgi:hypothetical protein